MMRWMRRRRRRRRMTQTLRPHQQLLVLDECLSYKVPPSRILYLLSVHYSSSLIPTGEKSNKNHEITHKTVRNVLFVLMS